MNIKKFFKKKQQDQEKGKDADKFFQKHKNNKQTQQMGLDMLRSMPKWQQKAMIRMLPKNERETVKRALAGEINAHDLTTGEEETKEKDLLTVEEYEQSEKKRLEEKRDKKA